MTGILYFSATGNSLFIAQEIQKDLGGSIRYIPKYNGNGEEFDRIIVVSPIYSYGLPVHVYNLLPTISREVPMYIVLNYGGMTGGADRFIYEYATGHGLKVQGVFTVKMPENYTLTFTVPRFYMESTLRGAPRRISKVIDAIEKGEQHIPKPRKTKADVYLSNMGKWHLTAADFSTTADCILCRKCVDVCPVENITIENGKVRFADRCVSCLGCYHRCPQKAIVYKNRTKQDRYINPDIRETDIGKDIS